MSEAERMMQAAGVIEDSVRRLEILFGDGYGSLLERLVTVLEKQQEKSSITESLQAIGAAIAAEQARKEGDDHNA